MSCEVDIKGYVLGEASPAERAAVETHAASCEQCRTEIQRLRITQDALLALREEEVPRRIAFVSDKVFEPTWWRRFWNSGPQLGFASAAMLAVAILVHGYTQPAISPQPGVPVAALESMVRQEVARRLDSAVARAVADAETRHQKKTMDLLDAAEKKFEFDRRADQLANAANMEILMKQVNRMYAVNNGMETGQ
ncbi:MAG: zf-HC2 domain-containing protein [Bryobacteraceae bacterium]|nr:zf-HC2 domain-containing protein [Bryobacteraceae bacterium]